MVEIEERPEPSGIVARRVAQRYFRHENTVLVIALIALIGGLAIITKGLTIRAANMMNILLQSSIRGVASVGQAFVMLSAGIDVYVWAFDLKTEVGKGKLGNVCRDWEVGGSDIVGQYFVDYAESTGEHLNILELWGMRSQDLDQERHRGFRCPVDQCELCTVIETLDCQWSDELAASLVMDAFTAHPELNALYAHGGGGTGAIEGLKAIGRLVLPDDPDHVITAFNDCDTVTVETLDAGNLDAFGTHQSWDLCDVVVKLAFTHTILGQPVPGKIDVPMKVITRDNIDTEEGKVLGAPVYPRMPVGQWDLWPVLDTSLGVSPGLVGPDGNYVEIETPTKALRMELRGY